MLRITFFILITNLVLNTNEESPKYYMGSYHNLLKSELTFIEERVETKRVILCLLGTLGPSVVYDSVFTDSIFDDNFKLIKKKNKYIFSIDLNYDELDHNMYVSANKEDYQRTFDLRPCTIRDVSSVLNDAYYLKIRNSDHKKIEVLDKRDVLEYPSPLFQLYDNGLSKFKDLREMLDETIFKVKVDSFSNDFWKKIDYNNLGKKQ